METDIIKIDGVFLVRATEHIFKFVSSFQEAIKLQETWRLI